MISLLFLAASAFAKPACTVEAITNKCEELKKNISTQWIYMPDKTYFRNPEYDNWRWSWTYTSRNWQAGVSEARQKRVQELVESTRQNLIASVLKGRAENQLSAGEKSQLIRLRTLRFDLKESLNTQSSVCVGLGPNAYYDAKEHRFVLCNGTMNVPDRSLAQTIGHEMGHAIDPCTLSLPLHKTAKGYAIDGRSLFTENPQPLGEEVAAAVPLEQYPQKQEMQCFAKNGWQDELSEADTIELADLFVKHRGGKREDYLTNIKQYSQCYRPKGQGNPIQETIADMWGGRSLAAYNEKQPPENAMDTISTFSMFLEKVCGPEADKHEAGKNDEHRPGRQRWDEIILTNPRLQRVLGCEPKHPTCDQDHGPAGTGQGTGPQNSTTTR